MTAEQFIIWLKGVVAASNDYAPTPKVWDIIKEELDNIEEDSFLNVNTFRNPSAPESPYYNGDVNWWQHPINRVQAGSKVGEGGMGVLNVGSISGSLVGDSSKFIVQSSQSQEVKLCSGENCYTTVWNDQMGAWHYTNYPEGFGYYTNSTADQKKEKQKLND